ncbi:hypothetical protein GJAV_G00204230 [Gymnothorax javanicus]|nr:hypothetical protein GJAV_G00204230 [Gymnothorax javanicus]
MGDVAKGKKVFVQKPARPKAFPTLTPTRAKVSFGERPHLWSTWKTLKNTFLERR